MTAAGSDTAPETCSPAAAAAVRPTWVAPHPESKSVSLRVGNAQISGFAAPGYDAVVDAFATNFQGAERGASFCLTAGSTRVVDLVGGMASVDTPWSENTLAVFYSCSKMLAALVVHRLIEQSKLSLDAPLTDVWPELEAARQGGTLRMMLAHTLGLPALDSKLRTGAYNDHGYMAAQLAKQQPFWAPGTRVGYHPITFGYLLGELVRRVDGRTLGQMFAEDFARPLDLDLFIGLPAAQFERVAPISAYRPKSDEPVSHVNLASRRIGSIQNLWLFNSGGWSLDAINSAEGLAPEIPAAAGVGNARSLAALLSIFNAPMQLAAVGLSALTTKRLQAVTSATHQDATLLTKTRFSLGFMKSMDNREDPAADNFLIGEPAFGHVGHGGSFGFCDPQARIAAAYVMNQQGAGVLVNQRGQSLIDACYRHLGYSGVAAGAWSI